MSISPVSRNLLSEFLPVRGAKLQDCDKGRHLGHLLRATIVTAGLFISGSGAKALADVPKVVTDITPIYSLVAQIMSGVGTPELIIQHGASPHQYQLRPSEARNLQKADLVVWVGSDLAPSLSRSIDVLADGTKKLTLSELPGTVLLSTRELAVFGAEDQHDHDDHKDEHHDEHDRDDHKDEHHDEHDHDDHKDEHHDEHDHDDHKDEHHDEHHHDEHKDAHHDEHGHHAHEDEHHDDNAHDKHHDEHDHDDHKDERHDEHGHAHEGPDPHAWLDPVNAQYWLGEIAATLSVLDPEHAAQYNANAKASVAALRTLTEKIEADLKAKPPKGFIVYHDAYQYFETRFDVKASGAISTSDMQRPSAARIAALNAHLSQSNIHCIFSEPQFNAGIISALESEGSLTHLVIDPLGSDLDIEANFYGQLLEAVTDSLLACK